MGLLTRIINRMPATVGQKAKAAALPVTLASDEDLLAVLGAVTASPTANTIADRLKALQTAIGVAGDTAGANTVIGQLKQIVINTAA